MIFLKLIKAHFTPSARTSAPLYQTYSAGIAFPPLELRQKVEGHVAGGRFLLLNKTFFFSAENFKGFNPNEIVKSRSEC